MSDRMRALVKSRPEPGLWMEQVLVPELGPSDVLIKVRKSAICGTDVHIWNWDEWSAATVPAPMVTGHEFCGEIAQIGSSVTKFSVGQRVSAEGHITCGACRNCRAGNGHLCRNALGLGVNRPGSFAEYVSLPEANIVPIPDDIPDEIAAIFDPFGNAVHTALSFNCVAEDVLVTGAGPIGIMSAMVAKRAGARKVAITDINARRLALAREVGVDYTVNVAEESIAEAMPRMGLIEGFDVGLEMSGAAPAFRDMIDAMNNGGKVAVLGISPTAFEIDWNKVIFKMLTLKGIYGREIFETWYKMIAFVQGGMDLTPLITHRLSVDQFEAGFAAMRDGSAAKVILSWD
ncbi:MAG: L-threonine 3-dehydrogenase [Pseudomonadota bacterium]